MKIVIAGAGEVGSHLAKLLSYGEQSWGYCKNEDFYSLRHLMYAIDRIMCLGGSYLLNAGPNAEGEITEEYASRLRRIGEWYNHMEGCLECHEEDKFDYYMRANKAIVTKKDGKSYFHFIEGLRSSSFALQLFPSIPKKVRLMNTGETLKASIDKLPEYSATNGQAQYFLHISGIPVDDLANEPIVVEFEW